MAVLGLPAAHRQGMRAGSLTWELGPGSWQEKPAGVQSTPGVPWEPEQGSGGQSAFLGRSQQGPFFQAEQLLQPNNQTKFYREFLGIVAGEQLEPRGLGEAVQGLCEHTSIFWVRRGHGKWGTPLGRASSSFSSASKRIRLCCTAADAAQDRLPRPRTGTGDL